MSTLGDIFGAWRGLLEDVDDYVAGLRPEWDRFPLADDEEATRSADLD